MKGVMGLAVLLIAIIGGWYLYQQNQSATKPATSVSPLAAASNIALVSASPSPSVSASVDQTVVTSATIETSRGTITIALLPKVAPKTVANFAGLAKKGFYDNLTFHRVESWVAQGGDPTGTGGGGQSIYGGTFVEDTFDTSSAAAKAGYQPGVVAMAKTGADPAFAGTSQFFIMKQAQPLPLEYTIFGQVTNGMTAVQALQIGDKMTKVTVSP